MSALAPFSRPRPLVLSDVVRDGRDSDQVLQFDVFEVAARDPDDAASSESATPDDIQRSRAFVRALEANDVCIRAGCGCHALSPDADREARIFRMYVNSLETTRPFTIKRDVRDETKALILGDAFRESVCRSAALRRTEKCARALDLDECDTVVEYSHVNMREPVCFRRKGQATGVLEFFFSVAVDAPGSAVGKVRGDADVPWIGSAVVPRSVFTFAHLAKLGAHARLLARPHGVPAPLVAIANDDVARTRLLYVLETAGAPISVDFPTDRENASPNVARKKLAGKRRVEQNIALGVLRDMVTYRIRASSIRIMNAASAINLETEKNAEHGREFHRRKNIDESGGRRRIYEL